MPYPVEHIEGIGRNYGAKLREAGICTTADLLRAGGDRQRRRELARRTGIEEGRLAKWVVMADFMRIKGIGRQYAELLEAVGVRTVRQLRGEQAADLERRMRKVNGEGRVTRALPARKTIARWIEQAGSLPPAVSS